MNSKHLLPTMLICWLVFLVIGLTRLDAQCSKATIKNTTDDPISLRIHSDDCGSFDLTLNAHEVVSHTLTSCEIVSVDILDGNGNVIASCDVDPNDCIGTIGGSQPQACTIPAPWNTILVCPCSVKVG